MGLTREIQRFIIEHGGVCGYQASREEEGVLFGTEHVPEDTECILVVGGDGTLLGAARNMAEKNIPLIGVNTGHVGYLCELEADTVLHGVKRLLAGESYAVEQRMLLSGFCMTREGNTKERTALNDIVIHRRGRLQVVDLILL